MCTLVIFLDITSHESGVETKKTPALSSLVSGLVRQHDVTLYKKGILYVFVNKNDVIYFPPCFNKVPHQHQACLKI